MISFLRKVRMSLIENSQARKYLFYAIGEIALVVIGILIALQINNWNEWRKDRYKERKVLGELMTTLESNLEIIDVYLSQSEDFSKSSRIILNTIEYKLKYHDSLNLHFQLARIPNTIVSFTSSGYENAKNLGFDIILSDTLRKSIVELFEVYYHRFMEQLAYFASFQPDRAKYIDELFHYNMEAFDPNNPVRVPIIPFDYQKLLDDRYLYSMLKSVLVQREIMASRISWCKRETGRVLQLINKELGEG